MSTQMAKNYTDMPHKIIMQQDAVVAEVAWTNSFADAVGILKELVQLQIDLFEKLEEAETIDKSIKMSFINIGIYAEIIATESNDDNEIGREFYRRTYTIVPDKEGEQIDGIKRRYVFNPKENQ